MDEVIILSDLHLSRYDCKVPALMNFIMDNPSKTLILNGDIFDQKAWWKDKGKLYNSLHRQSAKAIWDILKARKTKVYYIVGNHDWLMMFLIPFGFLLGVKIRFRLKIGDYLLEHGNLIHPYLKIRGIKSEGGHHSDYLEYAQLRNKILIVGHSHWPTNIANIVIDEGDWVKHNSYLTIENEVSELKKY